MNALVSKVSSTLSPVRNSSIAPDISHLVDEQLLHFGIDPGGQFGKQLATLAEQLYGCQGSIDDLWVLAQQEIANLEHDDSIALFNAKKFLSFQIAKILDAFQNGFRRSHQQLGLSNATNAAHGPYPLVDNVAALFSATPVIARTATYTFACADWIADAFEGREFMHPVYSRLLNPTSIALANHIVDLECGQLAPEYLAWNFNSGMAAIDSTLSHLLGHRDIVISSRNVYGGVHQLLNDWYAKPSNLDIAVEPFDGATVDDFLACWSRVRENHADRLRDGRQAYLYLESPCNPHGFVLDVPELCKTAHQLGIRVVLDATVGTPFLQRPLQAEDPAERPDFLVHSYTKDLSGTGSVIGGCAIARNEDMFLPKGQPGWEETMFWNVYYVKGAFLSADSAFEIMEGMRTLGLRMLSKCINTIILARYLDAHPDIQVNCNAVEGHCNAGIREKELALGLPAPLFTFEMRSLDSETFRRFFDNLEPVYSHQISLGQTNTIISCPGLTTHSELSLEDQRRCGIYPNTVRVSLGCESPGDLVNHFAAVARHIIDPAKPGFSAGLMNQGDTVALIRETYMESQKRFIEGELAEAWRVAPAPMVSAA
ncbi:MAG TPA: aminotransferase class I/II-fold pyridoxal phosphate-dependent enzyme [Xanthomonadales bacterium]|nr:aminotransferase class I/II-fold pyridoxal phosphate-dependent enzyme [Xanthomonadales bacterium]